jgi:hypothetical protein
MDMTMRKFVSVVAGACAVVAAADSASACSCQRNPDADQIYASSAAVFTGTVRRVEQSGSGAVTTFVVTEPFKGVARGALVQVRHGTSSPACGVNFELGLSYTLSAGRSNEGILVTGQCSTWMFLPHVRLSAGMIARMRELAAARRP